MKTVIMAFDRHPNFRMFSFLILLASLGHFSLLAQSYAYIQIEDGLHQKALIGGDTYDGNIYHQDAANRDNAKWQFKSAGDGYYYIFDVKHNKALVAGDDVNRVYHQALSTVQKVKGNDNDNDNAKWKLAPVGNGTFHITDKRHSKSLVAGTTYNGHVYHQTPQGRKNATWKLTVVGAETGIVPTEMEITSIASADGKVVLKGNCIAALKLPKNGPFKIDFTINRIFTGYTLAYQPPPVTPEENENTLIRATRGLQIHEENFLVLGNSIYKYGQLKLEEVVAFVDEDQKLTVTCPQ